MRVKVAVGKVSVSRPFVRMARSRLATGSWLSWLTRVVMSTVTETFVMRVPSTRSSPVTSGVRATAVLRNAAPTSSMR